MGIIDSLFGRKPDYLSAVGKAENALRPQVRKLLILDTNSDKGIKKLTLAPTLCLLHGFITFYSLKYHLKKAEHKLTVTLRVFNNLFGKKAAEEMIDALQIAMRDKSNVLYLSEGGNAAKYYEKEGLKLVSAFLGE